MTGTSYQKKGKKLYNSSLRIPNATTKSSEGARRGGGEDGGGAHQRHGFPPDAGASQRGEVDINRLL